MLAGKHFISAGMGAITGPIPFETLLGYAERFGPHDPEGFEDFVYYIAIVDSLYIAHAADQRSNDKPKD